MGKKKILLIDDEADFVTLVRVRLEANNYEVCVAFDGVEGLEKAEKEKPDLIILDIGMPKMDGYTFAKHIKAIGSLRDIPIIVLTGRGDKMKDLFTQEGIKDYMLKPFDTQELLQKIKNIFR